MAIPPSPEPAARPSAPTAPGARPAGATPTPAAPRGELGAKLERIAREQRPPVFQGRGWVVAVFFALAIGGLVVSWLGGGTASPLAQAVRDTYGNRPAEPEPERAMPRGPGIVAAEGPEPTDPPTPAPPPAPAPALPGEDTVVAPNAAGLAIAALRAPAAERPALRVLALHAFGEMAAQPTHRRAALEAAMRLSPDAVPEEAEQWQRLTRAAVAALDGPEAGLAIAFLASRFDRGGEEGQTALERVVDAEARPLELRIAAARALPLARRAVLAIRVGSRRDVHPALVSALR
jgi:hypothetical protein